MVTRLATADRTERVVRNPVRNMRYVARNAGGNAREIHRRLPGYEASPLIDLPVVARDLGLERLVLKDESSRLGLPAFKILGASFAVVRAVEARLGIDSSAWATLDDLARLAEPLRPMTLACATDGNHGRAVARMAHLLGFSAIVLVPEDMAEARIEAIRSEGAEVRVVDGSYDDAIDHSAELMSERCIVISDTAWPGYEDIPNWVIAGYSTILAEVDEAMGSERPDLIAVQIGVGALATAVTRHYRQGGRSPVIVGVEPTAAACLTASVEAGEPVQIPGPLDSIMSGLNCGTPSPLAWPDLSAGVDLFAAIEDERARQAMRDLAAAGVIAGECGGAGLAGLFALRDLGAWPDGVRSALIISSEGATDKRAYERIVGQIASC